jgi:DNA-binding IclR family transcriptional regulator
MQKKYLAPSVKKAFDILDTISLSREGIGLSKISKKLDMAKSTVHGITSILEELGVVTRDPITKKYGLGLTLFELGRRAYSQIDIREIARPFMEELMEKIQETVFLGILHGEHITILDVIESRHDFKITSPVGSNIPFLAAATGKVYLASFEEKKAKEIISSKGLPRYTDKSITDPDLFLEEVRQAKINGYATDNEEYISGARAVAAPINGVSNRFALLWVVGFKSSLSDEKMEMSKKEIMEAVNSIKKRMREQSAIS